MPFEPKILNPDEEPTSGKPSKVGLPADPVWDDAEALDLPDDLAALAEQLHADANYLHECHPAGSAAMTRRPQPARVSVAGKVAAATAVLALVGLLVGAVIWGLPLGDNTNSSAMHHVTPGSGDGFVADFNEHDLTTADEHVFAVAPLVMMAPANEVSVEERPANTQPDRATLPPEEYPAAFLRNVSSPELDGVLDLLASDEAGISI